MDVQASRRYLALRIWQQDRMEHAFRYWLDHHPLAPLVVVELECIRLGVLGGKYGRV